MKCIVIFAFLLFWVNLIGQLPNGSTAPDFTATDLNGVEYNLYDILAEGKDVIIDFSATWCPPCWSYHNSKALDDLYRLAGPEGTDDVMIFFVEGDVATGLDDLNGLTIKTMGDWITGTPYPILDNSSIKAAYQISIYPTIIKICGDRKLQEEGRLTGQQFVPVLQNCPTVEYASEPFFFADKHVGCDDIEVSFEDDSWPRATSWAWDFGDGMTSNEQFPTHTYTEPGAYSVTLKVENSFGSNETVKDEFIYVGEGELFDSHSVGPQNNEVGYGKFYEDGRFALLFDAYKAVVLESVVVYSEKDADRRIVLLDQNGNLISSKVISIPEGESRVDLDIYVPGGIDYSLGLRSDAFLFRNDDGTAYPYDIDGLLSITRSTAGSSLAESRQYYYYFYDWRVREAACNDGASIFDQEINSFNLFPNPAVNLVTLEATDLNVADVRVMDLIGNVIKVTKKQQVDKVEIDISQLISGVFLISIGDAVQKFYKL